MTIDGIIEDFGFLDDWEDRYKYLIELGNSLEPLAASEMNGKTRVEGCVSQVWLVCDPVGEGENPVLRFRGYSDAHIVRGLVAIALAIHDGKTAKEVLEADEDGYFRQIGLQEHITPQRSNGLRALVQRIKAHAGAALAG